MLNDLKDFVYAHRGPRYRAVRNSDFERVDILQLKSLLQHRVAPPSKIMFLAYLKRTVRFPEQQNSKDYYLHNFNIMHNLIVGYTKNFIEFFDFLQMGCKAENVPELQSKLAEDETLVKAFYKRIPFQLGDHVHAMIPKSANQEIRRTRSAEQLMLYTDHFLKTLNRYFLKPFNNNKHLRQLSSFKLDQAYVSQNRQIDRKETQAGEYSKPSRLVHLEDDFDYTEIDVDQEETPKELKTSLIEGEVKESEELPDMRALRASISDDQDLQTTEEIMAPVQQEPIRKILLRPQPRISTPSPTAQNDQFPKACFKLLFFGKCKAPVCNQSHDSRSLMDALPYWEGRLKARQKQLEVAVQPGKPQSGLNSLFHVMEAFDYSEAQYSSIY